MSHHFLCHVPLVVDVGELGDGDVTGVGVLVHVAGRLLRLLRLLALEQLHEQLGRVLLLALDQLLELVGQRLLAH